MHERDAITSYYMACMGVYTQMHSLAIAVSNQQYSSRVGRFIAGRRAILDANHRDVEHALQSAADAGLKLRICAVEKALQVFIASCALNGVGAELMADACNVRDSLHSLSPWASV